MNPDILMLHRIRLSSTHKINELYYKRKMVISIERLFEIIDNRLSNGLSFGTIDQCLTSKNYFHLSFDDGFKEHLEVAYTLKEKYNLSNNHITFSVNIGNSIYKQYTGMDVIYELIKINKIQMLTDFLEIPAKSTISEMKSILINLHPDKLLQIHSFFQKDLKHLGELFLCEKDIVKLSKLFTIASHGIIHRNLTKYKQYSKDEIIKSKNELEKILNKKTDVFCYPEGKNDENVQNFVKIAGYKYGLSIKNELKNNYFIGRIII